MSRRSTPNTSPAPGSMLRGTPTSTTSNARPPRRSITRSTWLRSMSRSVAPGGDEQHVALDERGRHFVEGDGAPADAMRELFTSRHGAVGDDDLEHAGARQRERHALTHLARAQHEHAPVVERAETAVRQRHRRRRHRHRVPADRGLGAGALAHFDRVAERARQQRPARFLALGRLPCLAHLAEDLALADDHRVEPGGDAEEVRDRGVVVVGVDAGRRTRRDRRRRRRRGSRARPASPGGRAWRARTPPCGCTWRAARPRRGARSGRATRAPSGSAAGAIASRSRSSTGTVRWFRPTTTRDMRAASPWLRRHDRRGSIRACRNRAPVANLRLRRNVRTPGALPGPPTGCRAGSAYSGPSSASKRALSHEASAGLRPPVPIVTTRSPLRTTDIRVNEQFSGSSAELTQTWRSSAAANTAWSTSGSPVAVVASQAPSRSAGSNFRSSSRSLPASAHSRTSGVASGATTWTSAPASRSAAIFRAAMRPAPTTTHRRDATTRFTG